MAVKSAYYSGTAGTNYIDIPGLAYRKIVSFKREGLGYDIVTGTPGSRQVQYNDWLGRFIFINSFNSTTVSPPWSPIDLVTFEKIFIIWEE